MSVPPSLSIILTLTGHAFFDKLQEVIGTEIPILVRNVLLINDVDRAVQLSRFDKDSITVIENFIKHDFTLDMMPAGEKKEDYFGKYAKKRDKFALSLGQKLMIDLMVETCRKFTKSNVTPTEPAQSNNCNVENNSGASSSAEECGPRIVLQSKEKLMNLLFRSLTIYIRNADALIQFRDDEIEYKVQSNSFKQLGDATASVIICCPVKVCSKSFKVTYKSHKSSYVPTKKLPENQQPVPPKWCLFPIQSHLKTHNPSLPTSSPPILPSSPSHHRTEESLPDLTMQTSFEDSVAENPTTTNSSPENSQNNSVTLSEVITSTQRPQRKRTVPTRAVSAKRIKA